MRPITKPLTGDAHAEARRGAQLASLASAALEPIVGEYESELLSRMVNFVRARAAVPNEQVWATLGQLAACAELRLRIDAHRKAP